MNNRPLSEKYIGKRLLISNYSVSCSDLTEAGILEVSPSGEYVKIQIRKVDNTTYTKWCHAHDYVVLEELGSVMDKIGDAVEQFNKDLKETERKAREEFKKHSSPKTPPYHTGDFWEHVPTSICSSDYADAPDFRATNYYKEQVDAIHNLDDETVRKAFNEACKMSGLDLHIPNEEVKKQKWVHGMCNPPSPDWKKKN